MNIPVAPQEPAADLPLDETSSTEKVAASFANLDEQLDNALSFASGIVRKHWGQAEREQYPFWIGMLAMAFLGSAGFILRDIGFFPNLVSIVLPIIMLTGLVVIVGFYLKGLIGRFDRQWMLVSRDGQLFRYLRDASVVLGYPIELGEPNELMSTHLDLEFFEAVGAVEKWIDDSALPAPPPGPPAPDAPVGLYVSKTLLDKPSGGERHRVYEAEYRGKIVRAVSVRVDAAESGCDVTVGFTLRPRSAETRDNLITSVTGRIQDRLIASKVLGDIREAAGVEPVPIQAVDDLQQYPGTAPNQAV